MFEEFFAVFMDVKTLSVVKFWPVLVRMYQCLHTVLPQQHHQGNLLCQGTVKNAKRMTSSRPAVSKILSQTQNVYEAGIE